MEIVELRIPGINHRCGAPSLFEIGGDGIFGPQLPISCVVATGDWTIEIPKRVYGEKHEGSIA